MPHPKCTCPPGQCEALLLLLDKKEAQTFDTPIGVLVDARFDMFVVDADGAAAVIIGYLGGVRKTARMLCDFKPVQPRRDNEHAKRPPQAVHA